MMRITRLLVAMLALWIGGAVGAESVKLRDFDAKSLASIAAGQAGRPFVLALWSIHCEPCIREMGQWGPLQRRYPGVQIVLVAADMPRERKKVISTLSRYDLAGVQTWAFADDFEERVRFAIDRTWRGELPRTYLYDAGGKVQARSGAADAAWVEPWLAQQSRAK